MTELITILPHNIDDRKIQHVVNILKRGGLAIIPTDSIYAIVGDLYHRDVLHSLCRQIGKKPSKANFSILCKDLSNLSVYTSQIGNVVYKTMKRLLPGPYTFILNASNQVPKIFRQNKKTIGIRVPDNAITQAIIVALGNPLVTASIRSDDSIQEYLTEPEEIYEVWMNKVDVMVDAGAGNNIPTTVLDASSGELELVREGLGEI